MAETPTPADMLARAARTLHGDQWRMRLSRDLHVDDDTIRRWMTGRTDLPAGHGALDDTLALLRRRAREIETCADELARWIERARRTTPATDKPAANLPGPAPIAPRPAAVAAPSPTAVALSRRQIKEADRVGGIELIIPYPPHLQAPALKQGEESDASVAEEAYARQALGDLMQHDLVMVRVQVMIDCRPTGLPREGQVEPHLCCIIIGRRWVHATGAKQPKTMWHGG